MGGSVNVISDKTGRRMVKNPPSEYLPSVSKRTVENLLLCSTPGDAIALYVFYLLTANRQGTNRPYATVSFCAKGLKLSSTRVRRARKELMACELIEDYLDRDAAKHILKHYVHVKWVRRGPVHPVELPDCGAVHPVENPIPNASTSENENASISSEGNAQNPLTPFQGEAVNGCLHWEDTARGLLKCLHQNPDRILTTREKRALRQISVQIKAPDLQILSRYYGPVSDEKDEIGERQLLNARKQKLTTLARNLPEQFELARKWADRHPLPRPTKPPPTGWQAIQQELCPDSVILHSFNDLPLDIRQEIREMARSREAGSSGY
jgi:hypothetical protein